MRDQKKIGTFFQNNLVLMTILILVGVTAIIEPKFLSIANLGNIMNQFGPLSFVSLGMTVAIIGGFIDLSVVGIVSLSAVFTISMIDVIGQYGALVAGLGAGVDGVYQRAGYYQLRRDDAGQICLHYVWPEFGI